ncbi:S1 family peptidase [Myceligenerans pegani]|uniref:S1 family peptidase n=1 Tax=Myceligenerans pegani TaxID=2776917 RepID=A0ABR9MUL6_9MICO|nr:S1 family peptidase [Myceligenerans sp. TRM 65318]MBE1874810.1 S1 family peptidase [Myceligenerans sp. TRM 65318]MBE3017081.1 S1 family peptidase [Myceligenerans sp. TRM 65318]
MRRTRTRALVAATAATTLVGGVWTAAVANASPVPAPESDAIEMYEPGLLRAMERDLGLEAAEAVELMEFQAGANATSERLAKSLDESFAGSWLDGAEALTVAVTDTADVAAVEKAGAEAVVVDHSLEALDGWKAELDDVLADTQGIPSFYVDVESNQVVVDVHRGAKAKAAKAIRKAGIPADAVTYQVTDEQPRTLIDVVGGNAYYIGSSRCSVGFSATGGFVTAGHCGRVGATTSSPSGTFRTSSFPGNDYAYVQVASGNTLVGAVNNYSGGRVNVSGHSQAGVGTSVCRSGSTTGWHCGTIQALNATVTYAEGSVHGLIRTNVCAERGDSGGSLLAGTLAQGMTSGGSGNCSSGGTTYFQPVGEALSAAGVSLITNGGGGGNPGPGDCSGYESSLSGSLSSGGSAAHPNGSYFYTGSSGAHAGCLDGPSGTDFDLYLQKWNGSSWSTVAQGITSSSDETVTYSGTSGYYRWVVHAYSGSGSYTGGYNAP